MPELFELSAYEISAEEFFSTLLRHHADLVLDVRLKNANQLCGFTKGKDLAYLVPTITGAKYCHDLTFAPDKDLLDSYIKHTIDWNEYRSRYMKAMLEQNIVPYFEKEYGDFQHVCLLGTATRKRRSHSEALAELLRQDADGT